jgi:hypothetical protein
MEDGGVRHDDVMSVFFFLNKAQWHKNFVSNLRWEKVTA